MCVCVLYLLHMYIVHNVETAIFNSKWVPNSISPYLNKYGMQSHNCGVRMYVLGDPDFKYIISRLHRHLFPPFLKLAVVNVNVTRSQTLHHLEQFC